LTHRSTAAVSWSGERQENWGQHLRARGPIESVARTDRSREPGEVEADPAVVRRIVPGARLNDLGEGDHGARCSATTRRSCRRPSSWAAVSGTAGLPGSPKLRKDSPNKAAHARARCHVSADT
jgi:hypothetical protein